VGLYHRVWAHSDTTIDTLALEAVGHVPWWPEEHSEVTLHRILVHMIAETDRHAGHADIVRELIDGAAGLRDGNDNMPPGDQAWWETYRSRLERVGATVLVGLVDAGGVQPLRIASVLTPPSHCHFDGNRICALARFVNIVPARLGLP